MNSILSKRTRTQVARGVALGGALLSSLASAQSSEVYELSDFTIKEQRMANIRPVGTFQNPISNLDFEPRVDIQGRNMAEAQGDVTIRGGIFEATGFRIGSATLIDPQTGHYFAELPFAPEMLVGPTVETGTANALYGFNSTVGTLSYGLSEIATGGSASASVGEHNLNTQRLHQGYAGTLSENRDWIWGAEAEVSRSESDGTRAFSDHDFFRTTGRVQIIGPSSQTDLFGGYQSKFFGQFGMYTGEAFTAFDPFETENLKTRLFLLNHRQSYNVDSYIELTAYTRRHSDHYIFNRFSPNRRFVHETEAHAFGFSGKHDLEGEFALNYGGQLTTDSIESTNLENNFTSRDYVKLTLLPEYTFTLESGDTLTVQAGASLDDSNRDEDELSAILDVTWVRKHQNGGSDSAYLSYTETSQVAGYTAVGGSTGGLFASDPNLGRETSQNIELGLKVERSDWAVEAAVFYREDEDLIDWTFEQGSLNARSANNVDIETFGFEIIAVRKWETVEGIASYTYLHKDENYGDPLVIGSFYALNFPEHRATLGLIWHPFEGVEVRLDNELRTQEENPLRTGPEDAAYTQIGVSYFPEAIQGLELFLSWDKPWDEDFQEVPGTPGRGDQFAIGATFNW